MNLFVARDVIYSEINFASRERLDPLINFLAAFAPESFSARLYFALQIVICFVGAVFFFRNVFALKQAALYSAALYIISLYVILEADVVAWRSHWFAALAAVSIGALQGSWRALVGTLCITLLWIVSAGSLSVLGLLLVIGFVVLCSGKQEKLMPIISILSLAALIAYYYLPVYDMPLYPSNARLTPLSAAVFISPPIFGPYFNVRTLVESVFREELWWRSARTFLCLAALAVPYLLIRIRKHLDIGQAAKVISGFCLVFLFVSGDLLFSGPWAAHAPYAVITRIVPGLALSCLPWVIAPMLVLFGLACLPRDLDLATLRCSKVALIIVLSLGLIFEPGFFVLTRESKQFLSRRDEISKKKISNSPSRFVVDYWGDWVLDPELMEKRDYKNLHWLKINTDFITDLNASLNPEDAWFVLDGDPQTRWATSSPQRPGNFFEMKFDRAIKVVRIVLSVRKTPSDFPRGLRVDAIDAFGVYRTIFEKSDWLGPVYWTEKGYPYFGPQSDVVIDLPRETEVNGLKFTQTGSDPKYDWSIGEVKIFREGNQRL